MFLPITILFNYLMDGNYSNAQQILEQIMVFPTAKRIMSLFLYAIYSFHPLKFLKLLHLIFPGVTIE